MRLSLFILPFLAAKTLLVHAAQVTIATVTVNDLVNPLSVNTSTPIFGWTINSPSIRGAGFTAVQIQVFAASAVSTNIWDSGQVSTTGTHLIYSGTTLASRTNYGFRIRILDSASAWTSWATGTFGTGIFANADWSSAQWIGAANPSTNQPLLRTTFTVSKTISSAKLFITGLGIYEAYINGARVGDLYLTPGWTTYTRRVFYDTYDVTSQLSSGSNAIGIALGIYWFGGIYTWGPAADYGAWNGNLRAKAQILIIFSDGTNQTVVTDSTWKTHISGTICNTTTPDYEVFDARAESSEWATASFDVSSWSNVVLQTPPYTIVQSTPIEPVRIVQTLQAVAITNPATGVWVYDFGQNIAGIASATLSEAANTLVTMHYGEKLSSGRVINDDSRYQLSAYISAGTGSVTWHPRFTYYGFRYIELSGVAGTPNKGTVVAQRLHSDFRGTGWVTLSNPLLQWIHDAMWQTLVNNIMSNPTDGSDVEKLPWTADGALMADTAFSALNLKAVYTKWLQDITDSQLPSGNVESWAPSPVGMTTDPSAAWGNSYPELAWQLYQHYGDVSVLSNYYSSIKAYVNYEINARGSTGLVGTETWGDWITPTTNDYSVVGTAYLYRSITRLIQIASVLENTADVTSYGAYASAINSSFHAAFYQTATGDYRTSEAESFVQTDNILPVAFGMTNSARCQSIIDKVAANVVANSNHLETGALGTKWILPTLTQYGYKELAYTVATQTTYPSWGYWKSLGATTLWETWLSSARSNGHQFLGTVVDWFYQYLAGIQITGAGFKSISIIPYVPSNLTSAAATITTPRGDVTSSWTNSATEFVLTVVIPAGSTALVSLPIANGQSVTESGVAAASATGVKSLGTADGRASFTVVSGSYVFTVE